MTLTDRSATSWQNSTAKVKRSLRRALWAKAARPQQLLPDGKAWIWYVQGGRGSGKSRTGAEALAELVIRTIESGDGDEAGDWAVVAPTFGDARDICIEGPSGLRDPLAGWTDGPWTQAWNRSQGQLKLINGATLFADGADDGALRVQGKNLRGVWADEVGLWRRWEQAWDESLAFAVRLDPSCIIATGTPKAGHGLVKRLIFGDPELGISPADHKSMMQMVDNIDNLLPVMVDRLLERYNNTTLGRQELGGEYLEEVEGALWTSSLVQTNRLSEPGISRRIVVGVDPPGGATEAGIVAAGVTADCVCGVAGTHAYVLADVSTRGTPDQWGTAAVALFEDLQADRIVAEANYGGDMVESVIRSVDPTVSFKLVRATRGKAVRAEPIVALYEQGRVHHIGTFGDLESEMTSWVPSESNWSPNRVDALVWALTELDIVDRRPTQLHGQTLAQMRIGG